MRISISYSRNYISITFPEIQLEKVDTINNPSPSIQTILNFCLTMVRDLERERESDNTSIPKPREMMNARGQLQQQILGFLT